MLERLRNRRHISARVVSVRAAGIAAVRRIDLAAAAVVVVAVLAWPDAALGAGPDVIITPPGYNANLVARGDDTANLVVNMPFTMNWNGTDFTQIYINMNGNCSFGGGFTAYNPGTSTLAGTNGNIMAPFWADIDTRNVGASQVSYSSTTPGSIPQVDGRDAFIVNWIGVARYNNQVAPTNSFQLVIVDRSDTGAGNFDFIFNYDEIAWDIATSASSRRARAGWARAGVAFELPGSGVLAADASALTDSASSATSLVQNSYDSGGQLGRYVFRVRSGVVPNTPPVVAVTDRLLEGNVSGGHAGYTGIGDATATDPGGTVVSLTNDLPPTLPLGLTTVTWMATDNEGATGSAQQAVVVTDTTPPDNPALTNVSHQLGSWSSTTTAAVRWSGAADICAGVEGYSWEWSPGAPGVPDTIRDTHTTSTVSYTATTTVDAESFVTAAWPTGWTRSSATYVRLTNAAGRTRGDYAAEIWANNNTRRTVNFYRDYDLSGFSSATLDVWVQVSALSQGQDYARIEYSTNGGGSWTTLFNRTGASPALPWEGQTHALPVGGTVRVRFAGSVNNAAEYADFDDIVVNGYNVVTDSFIEATDTLPDGTWYFSLRTVDAVGNWSGPVSVGPFMVDTQPPVTTDDVPAGWVRAPLEIGLYATDAGAVSYTRYAVDAGAWTTYTAPISLAVEGTSTLRYYSADEAGRVETPRSTLVRIDTQPPTVPSTPFAGAVSTSAVELSWGASVDAVSGLSLYGVYRNGSLVATVTGTAYTDTGLTGGVTYDYVVTAFDVAGNESTPTAVLSEPVPASPLWIAIDTDTVSMGSLDPGTSSSVTSAAVVTVGGVGVRDYELLCSADDFQNVDPWAPMQLLPASALSFGVRGFAVRPEVPCATVPALVNTATGSTYRWGHDYTVDLGFVAPWTFEAGSYWTTLTFTVVPL